MTDSLRGISAEIAIFVIGEDAFSNLSDDLAVDFLTNLAVDAQTDLAVAPDTKWVGSTSVTSVTVLGKTADVLAGGSE